MRLLQALDASGPMRCSSGQAPFLNVRRVQLVQLAACHRLPAGYSSREYAEAGGLMSYGTTSRTRIVRSVSMPAASSRARSPPTCRCVQATKFELVINLKTAKMLGLTVPPTLLARADEVIE